jgi:AcrR family transcriptional regulator
VAAHKRPSNRLSVADWLQADYTLLAEQGVRALKIERLCQQVGATRGSFY